MRLTRALLACLFALASAAPGCGGADGPPGSGRGSLIIARGDSIFEYDIASGETAPLIEPQDDGAFLLDPAVSADGTRLAYIVQPPPRVSGDRYDAGSDLWVANRDGTEQQAVLAHSVPNQLIRFPQWGADGALYAIVQEIEDVGGVAHVAYTLQRIDPVTGARARLRDGVLAYAISPDGERAAYAVRTERDRETLYLGDLDGGTPGVLVDVSSQLSPFNSPRFAPDGATVAFAAADQALAPPMGQRLAALRPQPAAARTDGLPEDIWAVAAAGGEPRLLADLNEDLPALAWSGDGDRLYVLGAVGLYEVNARTGASDIIGPGVFHGQMAWSP